MAFDLEEVLALYDSDERVQPRPAGMSREVRGGTVLHLDSTGRESVVIHAGRRRRCAGFAS